MAAQICPICSAGKNYEVGSWVRCPRYAAPVCERHCNDCRFFSGYATSVVYCSFGRKDITDTEKNKP